MNMTIEFICCKCQLRTPIEQAINVDDKRFCAACFEWPVKKTLQWLNESTGCASFPAYVHFNPSTIPDRSICSDRAISKLTTCSAIHEQVTCPHCLELIRKSCAAGMVEVKPGDVPGRSMTPLEWVNQNGENDKDGSKIAALLGSLLGK